MCPRQIALLVMAGVVLPVVSPPPEAAETLRRWEREATSVDHQTLLQWSDTVTQGSARGDTDTINGLLNIIRDESQTTDSRAIALSAASRTAGEASVQPIVQLVRDYYEGRMVSADVDDAAERKRIHSAHSLMIRGFVQNDLEQLLEAADDDTPIFLFLRDYHLDGVVLDMRAKCADLLAKCTVSPDLRRVALLEIVDSHKKRGAPPIAIQDQLDAAAYPRLRELVLQHRDPVEFHYAAAEALSYLGDQEIVAHLERLVPEFQGTHPRHAESLLRFIWRVQVQHPRSNLLDYISSTGPPGHLERRYWAVRRAHKLGVEPERIREAILAHERNATARAYRVEVRLLKQVGTELGILRDGDLPDVKLPNKRPVP